MIATNKEIVELDATQDALNRMKKAHDEGKGCYLTAKMIKSLNLTTFGQIWEEKDPRTEN